MQIRWRVRKRRTSGEGGRRQGERNVSDGLTERKQLTRASLRHRLSPILFACLPQNPKTSEEESCALLWRRANARARVPFTVFVVRVSSFSRPLCSAPQQNASRSQSSTSFFLLILSRLHPKPIRLDLDAKDHSVDLTNSKRVKLLREISLGASQIRQVCVHTSPTYMNIYNIFI